MTQPPEPIQRNHFAARERLLALAARDPRRAIRIARSWLEQADPASAWPNYLLGSALLRWERVPAAREHLAIALAAFAAADEQRMVRQCAYSLLVARQLTGEGAALQADWDALIAQCSDVGDWSLAARARAEQIAHLNVLGRPRDARSLAEQSTPLLVGYGAPADQARFDHVVGVALASCGDPGGAALRLEHASERFNNLRQPIGVARVLFERAWLWQRRERFDLAYSDLQQALAIFQRFDLPLRIAFCEKDLGTVAAGRGDYATAISQALRARGQFLAIGRTDLVARCDLNLGAVAHYLGLFDLATAAYRRAQDVYLALGDQRLWLICQRNQAMVLAAQGQPHAALEALQALELPVQAMGDRLEAAELLLERAGVLRQLGQHANALACFDTAWRQFRTLENVAGEAKCLLDEGWLWLDLDEWATAEPCLREAEMALAGRPAHRWRALHGLGRVAELRGDAEQALAYYETAGAIVADVRRSLASEHASSGVFAQASRLYQDALRLAARQRKADRILAIVECQRALALQRQIAEPDAAVPPELAARRDALRERLRALQAAGAPDEQIDAVLQQYTDVLLHTRHSTARAVEVPYQPLDVKQLRDQLTSAYGADWTVLVPVLIEHDLALVTLTAETLTLDHTPYDEQLRGLLARACLPRYRMSTFRDLAFIRGQTTAPWAGLYALAMRLLPPTVRARLHPAHRLLIVPTGPLHALPWAALRLDSGWLCQHAIIEQLAMLGGSWRSPSRLDPGASALLVACERFGDRAPELTNARASLDLVQACWPGVCTRLENEQATRRALLALSSSGELAGYQLIHVVSHAQLSAARGLLGHIKFADDDLLIDDVLQLRLEGALVVLAACDGAASEVLPGDELLSITRALLAAGAAGVVASVWPTYDQALPAIVEHFYRSLAGGADPALALARAQRALITDAHADQQPTNILGTPFIWAGFGVMRIGLA
jgi:tetratricopeptide (TPR) repeat protein